jgi:hypothetical protein
MGSRRGVYHRLRRNQSVQELEDSRLSACGMTSCGEDLAKPCGKKAWIAAALKPPSAQARSNPTPREDAFAMKAGSAAIRFCDPRPFFSRDFTSPPASTAFCPLLSSAIWNLESDIPQGGPGWWAFRRPGLQPGKSPRSPGAPGQAPSAATTTNGNRGMLLMLWVPKIPQHRIGAVAIRCWR